MALGEFTKQIAQQALLSATSKEPAAPPQPESASAVVLAQLAAMQKALKEDEELVVMHHKVRVLEVYAPSGDILVLTGPDAERALTRVICGAASLELVCKAMKSPAGAKPVRLTLRAAKGS